MSISTQSVPDSIDGVAYSATLQAIGGSGGYKWSWTATNGVLPNGLTLEAATGKITGTPTQANTQSDFIVTVVDSENHTAAKTFSILVHPRLQITGELSAAHLSYPFTSNLYCFAVPIVQWTVKSGTLPPGIALAGPSMWSVGLSGTPTQAGSYSFTLQAQEGYNSRQNYTPQVGTRDFTLVVDTALKITTTALQSARRGLPYTDTVKAVNGVLPLHWSATGLTVGLAIDAATGQISGTPTQAVYNSIVVTVTDSSTPPVSDRITLWLYIQEPMTVSANPIQLTLGKASWTGFYASPAMYPTIWTVTGNLPAGITASSTGGLSGTPTELGSYTVLAVAQDSSNPPQTASRLVPLEVVPQSLSAGCSSANSWVGEPFTIALTGNGGIPPYAFAPWAGSLPDGVTLDAGTGQISGVPASPGFYDFVAQVADSASPPQSVRAECVVQVRVPVVSAGRNDTLANATPIGNGTVYASISPFADPASSVNPDSDYYRLFGRAGQVVSITVSKQGNSRVDPVIEILDANGRPFTTCRNWGTGDGLAPGTVDPTPSAFDDICVNDDIELGVNQNAALDFQVPGPGTMVPFYLHVLDERGDARPDMLYYINVSGASDPVTLRKSLPAAVVGASYISAMSASGGYGPYTYALVSGSLPPGLTMTDGGTVSGTPTTVGRYVVTVTATDSGSTPQTATGEVVIYVADALRIIAPDPIPEATSGVPYALPIDVAGGFLTTLEFWGSQWTAGITFQRGMLSGVPPAPGTFTGVIRAYSSGSNAAVTRNVSLVVKPGPLSITAQQLPDAATTSATYNSDLTPAGGTPPFTWSVLTGSLPPGLVLTPDRGEILGRATASGTYTFTVQVADSGSPQQTASRAFTLNVVGP